jgi:hypothetical protein
MKSLLYILLLLLLPVNGTCSQMPTPHSTEGKRTAGTLQDCCRKNIEQLADKLKDCLFEYQQPGETQITQNIGQNSYRRLYSSFKSKTATTISSAHKTTISSADTCHKAVATSRHSHGYYIYALRHIII